MRRRLCLFALGMVIAVAPIIAWPQHAKRVPHVGILSLAAGQTDPLYESFRQGLRELGYREGENLRIEFRGAQGNVDRLQHLAQELVQLKVDVLVVGNTPAALAAQRATSTIPIVIATSDPLAAGLVRNLARPGGNITGLSSMMAEIGNKRLQLLKETIPRLTAVTVLWNPDMPLLKPLTEDLTSAARSLSIELKFVGARSAAELESAFRSIGKSQSQALYIFESPLFYLHRLTLATLASKTNLPAIYGSKAFAEAGGLMSYGVNYADQTYRLAAYVDKILKGAKPGDLPIEQPTKFEFVLNLKTATTLGITIPQSVLLQADEVIR